MSYLQQLTRPTLILNETIADRNLNAMAQKIANAGLEFRPHFKTHQSLKVAHWYKLLDVTKITVSSVRMASYFVSDWNDITIAFPFNRHEVDVINAIPERVQLQLVVLEESTVKALSETLTRPVNILIKVDSGYGRTGIPAKNIAALTKLKSTIEALPKLTFVGFLAHAGHSYNSTNNKEILDIHQQSEAKVAALRAHFGEGYTYSSGDTPTCSVATEFNGPTELRPGNHIFYDCMMHNISACTYNDVAVCMAVPVVAKHAEEQKIIVHGGGVHFSKDSLSTPDGSTYFGKVVPLTSEGWGAVNDDWHVAALSQEHGTLKALNPAAFDAVQVGDWLGILPVHSCLTANLMKGFLGVSGTVYDHCEGQ